MTQQPQPPDLENSQVEAENRNNPINVYRREKGRRLLESLMQEKAKEKGGA